jgi:hypothetical protein
MPHPLQVCEVQRPVVHRNSLSVKFSYSTVRVLRWQIEQCPRVSSSLASCCMFDSGLVLGGREVTDMRWYCSSAECYPQ